MEFWVYLLCEQCMLLCNSDYVPAGITSTLAMLIQIILNTTLDPAQEKF